jgi:Family of unknown function (DUF5572)
MLRARCFYFARKTGTKVDYEAYKAWRAAKQPAVAAPEEQKPEENVTASGPSNVLPAAVPHSEEDKPAEAPAEASPAASIPAPPEQSTQTESGQQSSDMPYSANFQHIVELITSGKPIPGIKEIPDTIKAGEESTRSRGLRLKPWETEESTEQDLEKKEEEKEETENAELFPDREVNGTS